MSGPNLLVHFIVTEDDYQFKAVPRFGVYSFRVLAVHPDRGMRLDTEIRSEMLHFCLDNFDKDSIFIENMAQDYYFLNKADCVYFLMRFRGEQQ
jgi:hypothetical protein